MFLVLTSYWLQGKCARINLSQADFQSLALAHLFEVRNLLTTKFFFMDRSSLNCSSLNQWFAER
jgi:hypothetical protein